MESIPTHVHVHQVIPMQTAILKSITVHLSLARMEEHVLMALLTIDVCVQLVILVLIVITDLHNNCTYRPCQNGGTCTIGINSYTYACVPGYTGNNCTSIIDNCVSQPGQNGASMESISTPVHAHLVSLTVTAIPSSTTVFLSHARTEEPAPQESIPTFAHVHQASLISIVLLISINDCISQPCINGGTCVDYVNNYTCICPSTYGGTNCTKLTFLISNVLFLVSCF